MKPFLFLLITLLTVQTVSSQQTKGKALLEFEDYATRQNYKGKKAPLIIERHHPFRTRMREVYRQKPNFAGHYILGFWGCGAPCRTVVIFDAQTGKEIGGLRVSDWVWSSDFPCSIGEPMEYRLNSRLLIVYGSSDEQKKGIYYFALSRKGLKLIRSIETVEGLKQHSGCNNLPPSSDL